MGFRMKDKAHSSLDWFFKSKDGKWAIVQTPNTLLMFWLVLTVGIRMVDGGELRDGLGLLRDAVLFAWSYLELTSGTSRFRRVVGATIMILVIIGFFR